MWRCVTEEREERKKRSKLRAGVPEEEGDDQRRGLRTKRIVE